MKNIKTARNRSGEKIHESLIKEIFLRNLSFFAFCEYVCKFASAYAIWLVVIKMWILK